MAEIIIPDSSVVLVGMMGSGKTSLGEGLSALYDRPMVDTDGLIKEAAGRACKELLDDPDEDFAEHQRAAILSIEPNVSTIYPTGGSVPMYPELVEYLGFGLIVYINASAQVLQTRLSAERIAALNNPERLSFEELLGRRQPDYENAADISINVDDIDEPPAVTLGRLARKLSLPYSTTHIVNNRPRPRVS